jgi:membrane protein implicated in regulation of membrane protease activity
LTVSEVSVIGSVGSLVVGTRGDGGAGEVLLTVRGARETYLAWSAEPLPKGARVLVIAERGARTLVVEPWTDLD